MGNVLNIGGVAQVIQVAVAPVFLLTGIGAILGMLVNRLGRVTDRFRKLEEMMFRDNVQDKFIISVHEIEMKTLKLRAKAINRAIVLCTASAFLVCMVIIALFIGLLLEADFPLTITVLFISSMLSLLLGLSSFLQEVAISIRTMLISTLPN